MEPSNKSGSKLLPSNAYTKLNPGEEYQPIVSATDTRPEVTFWSIGMGLLMVVVFTAACVYMALRAGNAIEASVPIAILAIFFGKVRKNPSTILENVMVQSVGQAAGVVAAGAAFVIPALYINAKVGIDPKMAGTIGASWWQIFLACAIGGVLGTVLIIPLRKYFVKDLHGELPFPEATAINEILVTGEQSAAGAGKILLISFALGALFDLSIEALHLWNAGLSSGFLPWGVGETLGGARIDFQVSALAALFGLGYIIGLRYAAIIAAGSVLACLVMVPLAYVFMQKLGSFTYAGTSYKDVAALMPDEIFSAFIRPIGIGAIAVSGLIGILRMGKIVVGSVTLGFRSFTRKGRSEPAALRTERDLSPKTVVLIELFSMLAMGILFFVVAFLSKTPEKTASYTVGECGLFAVVGMGVGFLLSFLFTPVAAQAIAIVGTNPVSGMTLITIALAIGAMLLTGLTGTAGMVIALIIGTAVCTALSTSGALITDFKIGYWIGSTPRNQQRYKFLGIALAALVVAFVIPLMDQSYHFVVQDAAGTWISNQKVLPAPQANMLAAVSRGLMTDPANQPWLLYTLGGLVAIALFMAQVPMLAFALGMYLPFSVNMGILAGAFCGWMVAKTGKHNEVKKAREEQGPLIASGLMAGAAIFGILTAILRLPAIGAPIQYISVGVDYKVEAMVDGKPQCGVDSCQKLTLSKDSVCGETLRELIHQEDAQCKPIRGDGGEPLLSHPWYEGGVGRGLGLGMLLLLVLSCYALARLGARWQLSSHKPKEKG